MSDASRSLLTLVLLAVAGFCGFGFLATYEPPGFLAFRWFYGVLGTACLVGIAALWVWPLRSRGAGRRRP